MKTVEVSHFIHVSEIDGYFLPYVKSVLQKFFDLVPPEYVDQCTFQYDPNYASGAGDRIEISYNRPETSEEEHERIKNDKRLLEDRLVLAKHRFDLAKKELDDISKRIV